MDKQANKKSSRYKTILRKYTTTMVLGAALGGYIGSKVPNKIEYYPKSIPQVASGHTVSVPKYHDVVKGENATNIVKNEYKLANEHQIANKINELAKANKEKYPNVKIDNLSVVNGKLTKKPDGIKMDLIYPDDHYILPGLNYSKYVLEPNNKQIKAEKQTTNVPNYWPYIALGAIAGAAGALALHRATSRVKKATSSPIPITQEKTPIYPAPISKTTIDAKEITKDSLETSSAKNYAKSNYGPIEDDIVAPPFFGTLQSEPKISSPKSKAKNFFVSTYKKMVSFVRPSKEIDATQKGSVDFDPTDKVSWFEGVVYKFTGRKFYNSDKVVKKFLSGLKEQENIESARQYVNSATLELFNTKKYVRLFGISLSARMKRDWETRLNDPVNEKYASLQHTERENFYNKNN